MPASSVDPFDLSGGDSRKSVLYFYLTWFRTIYQANATELLQSLMPIVGADTYKVYPAFDGPFGDTFPRIEALFIPPDKAVFQFAGTTTAGQGINEVIRSQLVTSGPWQGRISAYFRDAALTSWARIADDVPARWIACGHSLGGAIADLISQYGAEGVVTAGQPRAGNATYADSRANTPKLRVVNWGDNVPRVPPSTNTAADYWPGLAVPLAVEQLTPGITYRHWGNAILLTSTGISNEAYQERSSGSELSIFLISLADGRPLVTGHQTDQYARNIRVSIPIRFPAEHDDFGFPNIHLLDNINNSLNQADGISWVLDGRNSVGLVGLLRQFVPSLSVPSFAQVIEANDVYPFQCEEPQ